MLVVYIYLMYKCDFKWLFFSICGHDVDWQRSNLTAGISQAVNWDRNLEVSRENQLFVNGGSEGFLILQLSDH